MSIKKKPRGLYYAEKSTRTRVATLGGQARGKALKEAKKKRLEELEKNL